MKLRYKILNRASLEMDGTRVILDISNVNAGDFSNIIGALARGEEPNFELEKV